MSRGAEHLTALFVNVLAKTGEVAEFDFAVAALRQASQSVIMFVEGARRLISGACRVVFMFSCHVAKHGGTGGKIYSTLWARVALDANCLFRQAERMKRLVGYP